MQALVQLAVLGDELLDLLERAHMGQHLDVGVRDAELGCRGTGHCLCRKPDRIADDVDGGQGRGVLVDDELALHGGLLETVPCRYGKGRRA